MTSILHALYAHLLFSRRSNSENHSLPVSSVPILKRLSVIVAAVVALGWVVAAPASGARVAAWDFTGENQLATSAADVYDARLDSSNLLTRGAGAAASAGGDSFRTVGFKNDGISVSNTDYFQFTLSASSGNTLSLSSIDIRVTGTTSFAVSPGVSQQFAYSTDGTNFTLIGSPQTSIGTNQTLSFDLSGVSALQNVAASTTITLRYYASGQTGTGGFGFFSDMPGNYGLDVGGILTAVPEPTTVVGGLLGVCGLFWHQRRRFAGLIKARRA